MQQAREGQQWQKFGKSRGGFSIKVLAATDTLCCPIRFIQIGGNESDCTQATPLMEGQGADYVTADKGYDSQAIIDAIVSKGAEPVIPPRCLRKIQRRYGHHICKEWNALSECSANSNNLNVLQAMVANWQPHFFHSCMSPPSLPD